MHQLAIVGQHQVDGDFIQHLRQVGRLSAIRDVEEQKLVGPVQLVVELILSVAQQCIDRLAVELDHCGEVEVNEVADGGVLAPRRPALEVRKHVPVPLNELIYGHLVNHGE